MIIEVSPFLVFSGNCEEAFEYYRSIFGGEYDFIYRYRDVPPGDLSPGYEDKILHVSLPLIRNVHLMGADATGEPAPERDAGPVLVGLRMNDEANTFRIFNALSDGGKVTVPLGKTFYADLFGSLVDRFGIGWSFNCNIGRESEA